MKRKVETASEWTVYLDKMGGRKNKTIEVYIILQYFDDEGWSFKLHELKELTEN